MTKEHTHSEGEQQLAENLTINEDHLLAHNVDEEPVEANRRLFTGLLLKFVVMLAIAYSVFHLYTLNVPEAVEGVLGRLGDGFFAAAA